MYRRIRSAYRIVSLLGAGGLMLQAGGCAVDANALIAGLLTSIATNLVSGVVFGAFNLVP